MRDPRLEPHPGNDAFDRRRREAHLAVEQSAEADRIVAGLAQWCCDTLFGTYVIDTRAYAYCLSALTAPLSASFPEHAFHSVSDAARKQALKTGFLALVERRDHSHRDTVALLLGRALAEALGHVVDNDLAQISEPLPTIWRLAWSDHLLGESFVESLRDLLRRSSTAQRSVLAVLENRIAEINRDPGLGASMSEHEEIRAMAEDWRAHPAIDRLWQVRSGHSRDDLLSLTADILPAARRLFLAHIDRLGFPHPIRQVLLRPAVWHDRDEIAAILEEASACSQDGRSWNGRLVALLALRAVDDHCDALWRSVHLESHPDDSDPRAMETVKDTLVPWLEQLARIVMSRSDGRFLAAQWLFTKVSDERMNRPRDGLREQARYGPLPRHELIEWIAQGLSNAGLTAATIDEMVEFPNVVTTNNLAPGRVVERHIDALTPRFGALVAMCLLDEASNQAHDRNEPNRLDLLDGLLVSRDSAFEVEATVEIESHDLPASSFGYLVAESLDPSTRWRQSWDLLVEQRRRLQHWNETMDSEALAPSSFLLSVGISGLAWLLSPPHRRPDEARTLWRHLFDQSRECWLTMSLSHMAETIERKIHRLFCWHPMVFGISATPENESKPDITGTANDYSELLAQDLDLLGGDDLMVTICCLNAYRNGASPAIMDAVLRLNSGRIQRLVRQFERWQKLEGEARERLGVISELAQLKAEIRRER